MWFASQTIPSISAVWGLIILPPRPCPCCGKESHFPTITELETTVKGIHWFFGWRRSFRLNIFVALFLDFLAYVLECYELLPGRIVVLFLQSTCTTISIHDVLRVLPISNTTNASRMTRTWRLNHVRVTSLRRNWFELLNKSVAICVLFFLDLLAWCGLSFSASWKLSLQFVFSRFVVGYKGSC